MIRAVLTATLAVLTANACATTVNPTRKSLQPAVEQYLRERGNFCLGKFDWPIEVSARDREIRTSDSLQMPVLERLGLVSATSPAGDPALKRYDLTAQGRKYYLVKDTVTAGPGDQGVHHPGDFCAARLSLDRVVSWNPPEMINGHPRTTVTYTYKVASAADWTQDPQIKRVFPMIARILDNAGTMQLMQSFTWSNRRGWVAVAPGG